MNKYNLRSKGAILSKKNTEDTTLTTPCATTMATPSDEAVPLTLESVLEAISGCKQDLSKQIDSKTSNIQTALTKIEISLSTLADQVGGLEERVSANEDNMSDVLHRLKKVEGALLTSQEKLEDLEDRSRRNNVILFGVPEKAEGRDAAAFFERIIPEVLSPIVFDTPLVAERCHRLGKPNADTSRQQPRPLIARVLNYRHRDLILSRSRQMREVHLENRRIFLHPDCSAETRKKKAAYKNVKQALLDKNITDYRLYHPAKLRVAHGGSIKWFNSPAEVEDFLKTLD